MRVTVRILFLLASPLAACGALQRTVVAPVAEASVVDGRCALDIAIDSPSVHAPQAYLLGSKMHRAVLRLRVPATSGQFLPSAVGVSMLPESGVERALSWPRGSVTLQADRLAIDLHERTMDTVRDFEYNGAYEVRHLDVCRRAG